MRKAIVDGVLVNLMDDGDDVWSAMRRENPPIVCVGCGGMANSQERRYGNLTVRIFAHNPGYGERCRLLGDMGESAQHEVLKERIVRRARQSGWATDIEVFSPDERVRADVVCTRGDRTHSWEAQLAPLKRSVANERHGHYVNAWGNTTWIHTRTRDWSKDIPCVRVDEETQRTVVGGIFVDDLAEELVPPTDVELYVPRILNNDAIQYLLEPFGFYRDLGATPHPLRRSGLQRRSEREGITYSTTDCPSDPGDLLGDDLAAPPVDPWAAKVAGPAMPSDLQALVPGTGMTYEGAARMAAARQGAGLPLNDQDRHVLAVAQRLQPAADPDRT